MPQKVIFVKDNHPAWAIIARAIEKGHFVYDPDGLSQWQAAGQYVQEMYRAGLIEADPDDEIDIVEIPTTEELRQHFGHYNDHEPLT